MSDSTRHALSGTPSTPTCSIFPTQRPSLHATSSPVGPSPCSQPRYSSRPQAPVSVISAPPNLLRPLLLQPRAMHLQWQASSQSRPCNPHNPAACSFNAGYKSQPLNKKKGDFFLGGKQRGPFSFGEKEKEKELAGRDGKQAGEGREANRERRKSEERREWREWSVLL